MKLETIVWTIILICGVGLIGMLAWNSPHGIGKAYVRDVPVLVSDTHPEGRWQKEESASLTQFLTAERDNPGQTAVRMSLPRTLGIWFAALMTLAIFSFIYKDNPFYKFAESVLVGVSAAYWMVVGFWDVIIPNLVGRLAPAMTKNMVLPGLEGRDTEADYWYLVPLALGIMLLWRLSPKGAWIARWPLAFIIGTTAGIRLIGFIHADFLTQIRATIVPLVVESNVGGVARFEFWASLANITLVLGVIACLVYFFFSFEHKGVVGKTARVGIWFLMITFGAAFGYTVMGRITLLASRLEFLFDEWLWLIDPTGKRAAIDAVVQAVPMLM